MPSPHFICIDSFLFARDLVCYSSESLVWRQAQQSSLNNEYILSVQEYIHILITGLYVLIV